MLLVGVDWAEAEHTACVRDPLGGVPQRLKLPHRPAGLRRLQAAIAEHEPTAAEVLVAIKRPDGLLVDTLLEAGYGVYALHPSAVERYRGRTRTRSAAAAQQSTGPGHPRHRPR
jgi:hypothetical protein